MAEFHTFLIMLDAHFKLQLEKADDSDFGTVLFVRILVGEE